MKFTFQKKYTTQDFSNTGFSSKLIQNYSGMVSQLSSGLAGLLTISDNMSAQWVNNQSITHNVVSTFTNPLINSSAPKSIQIFPNIYPIASYSASYNSGTKLISLTVNYSPGDQYITVSATGQQSLTTSIGTSITFNAEPTLQIGNALSYDGIGTFTTTQPGVYQFGYQVGFASSITGGRQSWITTSEDANRHAYSSNYSNPNASHGTTGVTEPLSLAASVTVGLTSVQYSGGNLLLSAATLGIPQMWGRLLTPVGLVDTPLILVWGG